jgi:methyltransferase family protein
MPAADRRVGPGPRGPVEVAQLCAALGALTGPLGLTELTGRTFCDVGCAGGLFSLAAHGLGARVRSLAFCAESARAAASLRQVYAPGSDWVIEQGSILDEAYIRGLGTFDVVHSREILHHTGDLWRGLRGAAGMVAAQGLLHVSIRDSGPPRRGGPRRAAVRWPGLARQPGAAPVEAATPAEVFGCLREQGFSMCYLQVCAVPGGCNEYVFELGSPRTGRVDGRCAR